MIQAATGRTVLVVDDQDELRAMLVRVLAGDGHRVLEASNGFEALEVLETEPDVSLVITDLLMPRMDGLELARQLADRPHIQILFMSAFPEQVSELPFAFLPKPFSPAALCAAVQRLLVPSQMQA
jgi:CheY-like chemotaxis protein